MKIDDFIYCHKNVKSYINYCEAIISKDAEIEYSVPSHIEKLIELSKRDRFDIEKEMPIDSVPIEWLCNYTGCCAIYYNFCIIPKNYTKEQINVLKSLKNNGIISCFSYVGIAEQNLRFKIDELS